MNDKKRARKILSCLVCFAVAALLVMGIVGRAACGTKSAITFDDTEMSLAEGDSQAISYTVTDKDAEITWTSSDTTVATVNPRGTVTGVSEGSSEITATLDTGDSASLTVNVYKRTITLSASKTTIDLDAGETSVTVTASVSDGAAVTWSSSDTDIATVSGGVVTASGWEIGDVTITASAGNASASIVITVTEYRPEDYYVMASATNAEVMADAGVWHYFNDGNSVVDGRAVHADSSVSATLLSFVEYFYYRYQPANSEVDENEYYTLTMKISMSSAAKVFMTDNAGDSATLNIKANEEREITFHGVRNTSQPFSIRINECADLKAGTPLVFTLSGISVAPGHIGTAIESDQDQSGKVDLDEYEITELNNAGVVADPGVWYYWADGDNGTDYNLDGTPYYSYGKAAISYSSIPNLGVTVSDNLRQTYQLRYQPKYEVGTRYHLTATISMTADGRLVYGTDSSNVTVYIKDGKVYSDKVESDPEPDFEPESDYSYESDFEYVNELDDATGYQIEYTGEVKNTPFYLGITPDDQNSPISLSIWDMTIEEIETPDVGEKTDLESATNQEVVANPGNWYHSSSDSSKISAYITSDGTVYYTVAAGTDVMSGDNTYQIRYMPEVASGTTVTITCTVTVEGGEEVYFLYGNDYKNSQDLTPNNDGTYSITWTGAVGSIDGSNKPFMIQVKAKSDDDNVVALTEETTIIVSDFAYSAALENGTNQTVVGNPGTWYHSSQDSSLISAYIASDGSIVYTVAAGADLSGSNTYQIRYMPEVADGTTVTITCTVTLTGEEGVYFLYGNDYKNSQDLTPNDDGTYTISWSGEVGYINGSYSPFMIQLKATEQGGSYVLTEDATIVVTDFKVTYEKEEGDLPEAGTAIQSGNNAAVVADPGNWYHSSSEESSVSAYIASDGSIVYTIAAGTDLGSNYTYQIRYMPDVESGTTVTITFTVTLMGGDEVYFLYGNDYMNSKDLTANSDGTYTVTWTGAVGEISGENKPFMIQLKASVADDSTVLTQDTTIIITDFTVTAKSEEETLPDDNVAIESGDNATVVGNPGNWYHSSSDSSKISAYITSDGSIVYTIEAGTEVGGSNTYQIRYMPDVADGTTVTITFTVTVSGGTEVYFLYGNDSKNSKDLTPNADGSYTVTWTGAVGSIDGSNKPFMIQVKAKDGDNDIALTQDTTIVVTNFSYVVPLSSGNNAAVIADPGTWYHSSSDEPSVSAYIASDGSIVYTIASGTEVGGSNTYQIRYMPEVEAGTTVTITCTVSVTGGEEVYFLYGNDSKSSKDLEANADGTYSITWTGSVGDNSNPFMIQVKAKDADNNDTALTGDTTIVVTDFTWSVSST